MLPVIGAVKSKPTAPHKVYHFQTVAGLDDRLTPLGTRHDLQIALHGHAIGRQLQPVEQGGKVQPFRDLPQFSVQMDVDQWGLQVRRGSLAEQVV
jgi:hypothetical protein